MNYKMLTDRVHAASRLASWVIKDKDLLDQELKKRVARVLREGEEPPDFAGVLDVLARLVAAEGEELEKLGRDRSRRFTDVSFLIHSRNSAFEDLYAEVVDVRRDLVRLCGSKEVRRYFDLDARTARNPERLEDEATRLINGLELFKMPPKGGLSADRAALISRLRTPRDRLREALLGLRDTRFDEGDVVKVKKTAMDLFDNIYVLVYQLVRALYDLAGKTKWRQGMRPPARRADARMGRRSIVKHLQESNWWPWGRRDDDRPKNVA